MSEVKTNKISSLASNNDITIDPDGTGDTIIASGNVGIGTTTPSSYDSRGNNLVVGDSGDAGITIFSGSTSDGRLVFAASGDTGLANGVIGYDQNSDAMAFEVGGSEAMRISSGKVRIGNSSGVYTEQFLVQSDTSSVNPMTVNNTRSSAATDYAIIFGRNGSIVGSIQTSLSATSYNTSSDYRLKTAVTYDWDATTRLKQLKPARFKWIVDGDDAEFVDGFIAHEVQTIVPESISGTKDEVDDGGNPVMQGIDQSKLVPLLVKTIQELEARITALEAE